MPPPVDGLSGKVALVTGAGAGLGRATAIALAKRGARVLVTDIDKVAAEETAHLIEGEALRVDVSKEDEVGAMVRHAERVLGPLYAAVNNAAVAQTLGPHLGPEELKKLYFDDGELRRIWSVNLDGVRHGMKHQLAVMRPRKSGVILNVASNTALRPWMGLPIYTASKAAVVGLTRATARRLAPEGLRINALCPGGMRTALLEAGTDRGRALAGMAASIPARRLATTEEIGNTAAWMCDADAGFMIGHALVIDGGATAW